MNLRNPVNTLTHALMHAIEIGLDGVPSETATQLLGPAADGPRRRRPMLAECEVAMFCQSWCPADMGFKEPSPCGHVDGEVAVVIGPQRDACVYFACQFAYHVNTPNRRFYLDVAAQAMAPMNQAKRYDGRDDEEAESVDYCVQMQIACLHAATAKHRPAHGRTIAGLLQSYAEKFLTLAQQAEPRADKATARAAS